MNSLIEVFRMEEINPKIRAKVIIKLGNLINYQYEANATEPLVFELVSILDKDNPILTDKSFLSRI